MVGESLLKLENILKLAYSSDNRELLTYLRRKGFLKTTILCSECNRILIEMNYRRSVDGVAFVCYRRSCSERKKRISIRKDTFFENFKISLDKILIILYYYFKNKDQTSISDDFDIKKTVAKKVYRAVQQRMNTYMNNIVEHRLGGEAIIVQIDESMFHYKQKYHTGRIPQHNRWVFGIVDTSSSPSNYYVTVVPDRKRETLLPIIQRVVREGSIIVSDEWRAYSTLYESFIHQTVNHSLYFVDPDTGLHTQNIESLWNKLKRKLKKMMGVGRGDLQSYLNRWMFVDNY